MKTVKVGCSGWSYNHWVGVFYPEKTEKKNFLSFYSKFFDTVEVNSTFYHLPFTGYVKGWVRKVPKGFLFSVKLNKKITHVKKLVDASKNCELFLERIKPLKENNCLGPILVQLPPSLHRDTDLLENFFTQLPLNKYRFTVEFRHKSWFHHETFNILRKLGVAFCIISAPRFPEIVEVTTDFTYIRFHGKERWYSYNYTEKELRLWGSRIKEMDVEEVFVYFNNDFNGYAVKNALELKKIMKERN